MTYKGIRDRVLRQLDEAGNTGTTLEVVRDAVTSAHQQRCGSYDWPWMRWPGEVTLTTTIGVRTYALHPEVGKLWYLRNATTKLPLVQEPDDGLADQILRATPQGTAERFFLSGQWPVGAQPSTASVITAVSTSASDTGSNYQVAIKGELAAGHLSGEILTLSGASDVSTTQAFRKITGVTKSRNFNGTLTLSAGSDTLLSLLACELGKQVPVIELLEEPTAAESLAYRFFKKPVDLVNDFDIPDLPSQFHDLLVYDSLLLISAYVPDISAASLQIWAAQQQKLETALLQTLVPNDTLGAYPAKIRDLFPPWDHF